MVAKADPIPEVAHPALRTPAMAAVRGAETGAGGTATAEAPAPPRTAIAEAAAPLRTATAEAPAPPVTATAAAPVVGAATGALPTTVDAAAGATWTLAVQAVGKRKPMLGAFLEACRFVGFSEGRVTLAMDDLHRAVIDEKENRAMTLEELQRSFGRALELRCVPPDAAMVAAPPAEADVKPMIENAIRWFEGDIIERRGTPGERMKP
jgi:hypothetical protein